MINIVKSKENGGYFASYRGISGTGKTKEDAYKELCIAFSLAFDKLESERDFAVRGNVKMQEIICSKKNSIKCKCDNVKNRMRK